MTTDSCQMPDCTDGVYTMVHLGNDRPMVAVCHPHLDAFATEYMVRAWMREHYLN